MSFPINILKAAAEKHGLAFLIIGGHAVNSYAPPRSTLDVDLLVRQADREQWCRVIQAEGYRLLNDGGAFLQFSPPYGVSFRLDLMLVNDSTFAKLSETARRVPCLGIQAWVPSALSLIALKLHAIRHGPAERKDKDWMDIVNLVRFTSLDPRSQQLADVFDRHGTIELYSEFRKRFSHVE